MGEELVKKTSDSESSDSDSSDENDGMHDIDDEETEKKIAELRENVILFLLPLSLTP